MSSSSDRIIALKLHALHEEDREWVLSQLDPASHRHLRTLLEELKELKFKLDTTLVNSIKHQVNPTAPVKDSDMHFINSASPQQIKNIFENEPKFLLNSLSVQHDWKWLPDFNKSTRTEVKGAGSSRSKHKNITVKAKKALFKIVSERMKQEAQLPEAAASHSQVTARIQRRFTVIRDKVLSWKR